MNLKNQETDNYAQPNRTPGNVSLYSDTIFSAEPTGRSGVKLSKRTQDEQYEKDQIPPMRVVASNSHGGSSYPPHQEEQGAGIYEERAVAREEKEFFFSKGDDERKRNDPRVGPIDYAPVDTEAAGIEQEELPQMSDRKPLVFIKPKKQYVSRNEKVQEEKYKCSKGHKMELQYTSRQNNKIPTCKRCKLDINEEEGHYNCSIQHKEYYHKSCIKYTSRRDQDFDCTDSAGDDGEDSDGKKIKDTGVISIIDTKGNQIVQKPNIRFLGYKKIFTDLLKQTSVVTMYPIESMIISYDSTKAITLTKKDDRTCFVKQYCLENYDMTFEEQLGGEPNSYIKCKEVEQNQHGTEFCILYFDDGKWFLRKFGKVTRTQQEIENDEIDINAVLGLDNYTMANEEFPDPFGTCCFVNDTTIFIGVFHNYTRTHHHFFWDCTKRAVQGELGRMVIDCNLKNFPYKCFFSETRQEVYLFYRQGLALMINPSKPNDFKTQQIINKDLGQMVMFGGEALIVRSSDKVYFFKQMVDKMTKIESWKLYHTLKVRGFIYYIKGNIRIQVTTDELIYFYLIDKETFMPDLENVMYNYMGCNQTMFGKKVRYSITYKPNQRSFDIYRRKFMHNLKVQMANENLEGAFGVSLPSLDVFLVAKVDQITVHDSNHFNQINTIPIKLMVTETREPNQVIGMTKSKCDRWLAVISGKNLIMNGQAQNQLFILKMVHDENGVNFEQVERIVVKDMPFCSGLCMQYYFKDFEDEPEELLFCKKTELFSLNIKTKAITTIHRFSPALTEQPVFYSQNHDQTVHVVASAQDGIWYDEKTDREVDLDGLYLVAAIQSVVFDQEEGVFYLLCNKRMEQLGFFLIKFKEADPEDHENLTMWKHRLDIDDVVLHILRGYDQATKQHFKELIIAYKTIYINTYNVVVQDISGPADERATLFNHESFQLWESSIFGMVLDTNKDFVSLSKGGINVLSLGAIHKRRLKDAEGQDKMIHSLASSSFLKTDAVNHIKFECQDYNNRIISIDQEYRKRIPGLEDQRETHCYSVYKIKIHEITLRELMILQSFYLCTTQSDITRLVRLQPYPKLFYKSFLELDCSTFLSYLSFDSQSLAYLLSDANAEYFDEKFPIIYKIKMPKKQGNDYCYRNAIDNALRSNQVMSVNMMINYIVKYQNNYVSALLLARQMPILLEKGISVAPLLQSKVFCMEFDYDEWPGNHTVATACIRPYSESIFHLRDRYQDVFPEAEFAVQDNKEGSAQMDASKAYKIKYRLNLLPVVGQYLQEGREDNANASLKNDDVALMDLLGATEELAIFDSETLQQYIEFKWLKYGRAHFIFGSCMHCLYVLMLMIYIDATYLHDAPGVPHTQYTLILSLAIIYPWIYDFIQLAQDGPAAYFSDPWNYADVYYIYGSILNIILQIFVGKWNVWVVINLSLIIVLMIVKTFFFLRIRESFTPIVIMLTNVIYDLRIFLMFYSILLFMFALLFSVVGVGLKEIQDLDHSAHGHAVTPYVPLPDVPAAGGSAVPAATADTAAAAGAARLLRGGKASAGRAVRATDALIPAEYKYLGMFFGQLFSVFRLSIGDQSLIGSTLSLSEAEAWLFWILWVLAIIVTNVIFLNFVVAEASASYTKVTETLNAVIWQERASMIHEAEGMTRRENKSKEKFPPYLVVRTLDT